MSLPARHSGRSDDFTLQKEVVAFDGLLQLYTRRNGLTIRNVERLEENQIANLKYLGFTAFL